MELTVYAGPACPWVFGRLLISVHPPRFLQPKSRFPSPAWFWPWHEGLVSAENSASQWSSATLTTVLRLFPILSLIYKRLWVLLNGIRTHSGFCILPCFNLSLYISPYLSSGVQWYLVTATQFHSFIFPSDFKLERVRPGTLGEPCGPVTARHELGAQGRTCSVLS